METNPHQAVADSITVAILEAGKLIDSGEIIRGAQIYNGVGEMLCNAAENMVVSEIMAPFKEFFPGL